MKIAVFGSAAGGEGEKLAAEVGRAIAKSGAITLTGGCGGYPGIAAASAIEAGGEHIAFSPGRDKAEHLQMRMPDVRGKYVFVPRDYKHAGQKAVCLKYRNVSSCAEADACIIIGGRIGTLNEFTNMYDMGKTIGVLEGSGGAADLIKGIIGKLNKPGAEIIYEEDPKKLVRMIIENGTD